MIAVSVGPDDFDAGAEIDRLTALGGGGVASFIGIVRADDRAGDRAGAAFADLTLEHYPGMTEAVITALAQGAMTRFGLIGVRIVHRVGTLAPGARIVFVGAAARHRTAALEATAFLIDRLKTEAPFWKRERFADGSGAWVEARVGDAEKAADWD